MNGRNTTSVACLAAISCLSLVALTAGCANQPTDSPAPLSRNTTIILPARSEPATATVSSAEMPADASAMSNTNAGPGGAAGTEASIAGRIDAAIIHNEQMTGSRIAAVVDSAGVATLSGTVQNAQQKALAEKAAHDTPGVVSLKDKLQIRPTGGAGHTETATRVLTAMPDGDGFDTADNSATANSSATPNAAPTPGVVVVNNYVPVPQQTASNNAPAPNVNVTVLPQNNGNGSPADAGYYGAANYPDYGTYGYTDYGYGDNGNNSSASVNYDSVSRSPAGVLDNRFVPSYLRTMNAANEYHNYLSNTGQ